MTMLINEDAYNRTIDENRKLREQLTDLSESVVLYLKEKNDKPFTVCKELESSIKLLEESVKDRLERADTVVKELRSFKIKREKGYK